MSGRPSIDIWATETNFPAGSDDWSGHALKTEPAADYFTPDTPAAAEEVNFALNRTTTQVQAILDYLGQIPAQNWPLTAQDTPVSGTLETDTGVYSNAIYDAAFGKWYLVSNNTAPAQFLMSSSDLGKTWSVQQSLGGSEYIGAFLVSNKDGLILIAWPHEDNDGDDNIRSKVYNQYLNTVSSGGTTTAPPVAVGFTAFYSGVSGSGGLWTIIGFNHRAGSGYCARTSTDGLNWVNRDSGLPLTFTSAIAGSGVFHSAQSPTRTVIFSDKAGCGSYISTDNGTVYSARLLTGSPGDYAGHSVKGVVWDGSQFIVGMTNGTITQFYSSDDGISWEGPQGIIVNRNIASMASCGSLIVCVSGTTANPRLIYSVDHAGTWRWGPKVLKDTGTLPRIDSSGIQFLARNTLWLNSSAVSGLPAMLAAPPDTSY